MYPGVSSGLRDQKRRQERREQQLQASGLAGYGVPLNHQQSPLLPMGAGDPGPNHLPGPYMGPPPPNQQQFCPPYDMMQEGSGYSMPGMPMANFSGGGRNQQFVQPNGGYQMQRSGGDQGMYNPNNVNFERPPQEYLDQSQSILSSCTGRKKALLVGVNYRGTKAELRGCVSDVHYVRDFLMSCYGFQQHPESMLVLTDDHNQPAFLPLRNNIIEAMKWLVRDLRPGDSIFFQFSGHGTRVKDLDGDEDDGYDEAICPLDYESAGLIVDDEINAILVRCLPPNVRLTAISDSCHSGSVLDLPYTYYSDGKLKVASKAKAFAKSAASGVFDIITGDRISGITNIIGGISNALKMKNRDPDTMAQYKGHAFSDTILISGCKDSQTSADTVIDGRNTGALTHAFVDTLKSNPRPTYAELLVGIRNILTGKYSQKPQLSTGRYIDMNNDYFII